MSLGLLSLIVLGLAALGLVLGRQRALATASGDTRRLHSLPGAYGTLAFLFTAVPAFVLMAVWLTAQPLAIERRIDTTLEGAGITQPDERALAMAEVRRIAGGIDTLLAQGGVTEAELVGLGADLRARLGEAGVALGSDIRPELVAAAVDYRSGTATGRTAMSGLVLAVAVAGFLLSLWRIHPDLRARNITERFVVVLLMGASLIAVLTTAGIILSLVSESWHFFKLYPAKDFFFSLTWNPQFRGGSSLGLWPLVWGTLYVSLVALMVAVPVGVMAAIYLSEYAGPKVRALAKPALEILAGIPSIVYGLFALVTVGPLLRDWFAMPMGLGESASSVATAGIVMGLMLIPYVSSLSDDIINAVPQSLRDGSFGLGATQSETIRQVVIPAALPGIVGAILLAASRAIGETMIVVMGAGAAAKLSLNPFEAMTTVTVKIVSQLTGDTEFASPETLVAFALGLTLFCFTLGLNVLALYIVRKYREQYE